MAPRLRRQDLDVATDALALALAVDAAYFHGGLAAAGAYLMKIERSRLMPIDIREYRALTKAPG